VICFGTIIVCIDGCSNMSLIPHIGDHPCRSLTSPRDDISDAAAVGDARQFLKRKFIGTSITMYARKKMRWKMREKCRSRKMRQKRDANETSAPPCASSLVLTPSGTSAPHLLRINQWCTFDIIASELLIAIFSSHKDINPCAASFVRLVAAISQCIDVGGQVRSVEVK